MPLTLEQQATLVRRWNKSIEPWFRVIDGRRWMCFECSICPTPTSETYQVLVCYSVGERPHVFVTSPKPVQEAHGQATPHLNFDGTLCLYDPAKQQWTSSDPLAYTILPWTSRWLFHYEHWLLFGEWRGDHDLGPLPKPDGLSPSPILEI